MIRLLPSPVKRVAKNVRSAIDPFYVALYRRRSGLPRAHPAGWTRISSADGSTIWRACFGPAALLS